MDINNLFGSRDKRLKILQFLKFIPDKLMLRIEYRLKIKKKLHLNRPVTFNEKLQWLKINDRNPRYTMMADKFGVREYIKNKIGEEYLIPILGCYDRFEDIPFSTLPEKFVLKCTHDSGSVMLCDKKTFNSEQAKIIIEKRLRQNAFWWAREWPYKNIKPRIIIEEFMMDKDNEFLPVYKFFCFNGEPKLIQLILNDKQETETVDYYDLNWNKQNIKQRFPNSTTIIKKPRKFDDMVEIAKKLSFETYFLRVDLYVINERIYFSEHTFYTDAGYSIFEPEIWDLELGKWINLPKASKHKK